MKNLFVTILVINGFVLKSQILYHQDSFNGGVTSVGFSTGQGFGSGIVNVHIEPGSTIRTAFICCYKIGDDSIKQVSLNSSTFDFNESDNISSFDHAGTYLNPIKIYIKDITTFISDNVSSSYSFNVPTQTSSGIGWSTSCVFLYIEYENMSLPKINTALWVNDQNLDGIEYYQMNDLSPVDVSFPVCLSLMVDRACDDQSDASRVWLNG
ncbi:MAG: hypothetical protein JNJ99_15620, partial [Crocinitomicaceae bacterium]|nr:hypothetical protein [Crocinitomicaceae bacterium]